MRSFAQLVPASLVLGVSLVWLLADAPPCPAQTGSTGSITGGFGGGVTGSFGGGMGGGANGLAGANGIGGASGLGGATGAGGGTGATGTRWDRTFFIPTQIASSGYIGSLSSGGLSGGAAGIGGFSGGRGHWRGSRRD